MLRHDRLAWVMAASLSTLAGFVDAFGFLKMGGFFVSFMSGNSTRLGVGLAERSSHAAIAAGLVVSFVFGVIAASLVGHYMRYNRSPTVLALVSILLAGAAIFHDFGVGWAAIGLTAAAMGAENVVFQRNGEVSIGLTYMTGTLVKFGQHVATAFLGGPRLLWVPYLLLWLGLVVGAILGTIVYRSLDLNGLWIAAAIAAGVALITATNSNTLST